VPKQKQFYARDNQDSSIVLIAGKVNVNFYNTIACYLYKNNGLVNITKLKLTYSNATANFQFTPKIHAELSEWRIDLHLINSSMDTLVTKVDSLVSGDVFLQMDSLIQLLLLQTHMLPEVMNLFVRIRMQSKLLGFVQNIIPVLILYLE